MLRLLSNLRRNNFLPVLYSLLLFVTLGTKSTYSQNSEQEIFRFLRMPTSAQLAGMGGNHVGLWNADGSLFFTNPAHLNESHHQSASLNFVNYYADARYSSLHYTHHLPEVGTLGLGFQYAGFGEMTRFNELGESLGTFQAGDYAIHTSISRGLYKHIQSAFTVHWMYSSLDSYQAAAFGFSGGMHYKHPEKTFAAGLVLKHVGMVYNSYNGSDEHLPFDLSIGLSFKPEKFPFLLALSLSDLHRWKLPVLGENNPSHLDYFVRHITIGGEANLGKHAFLRWGYQPYKHEQTQTGRAIDLAGASFGFGVIIKDYQFDLSRQSYSRMGGVVQVSLKRLP